MKRNKIIYWLSTGLMCLIFLFSSLMYLFNYEAAASFFENLGFPLWWIYPSATVKILGIIAILSRKSKLLKEWAYAGFFFDASMALTAHLMAADGAGSIATVALISVVVSRFFEPKVFPENT